MSCPICGKEPVPDYRPFCSRRCADIDLARWLGGDYRIPGPTDETAALPLPPALPGPPDSTPH